jgi:hypothetical protein
MKCDQAYESNIWTGKNHDSPAGAKGKPFPIPPIFSQRFFPRG